MCLILCAYLSHPDYPLVIAANRDEFFARPSRAAHFWPEQPDLLAGRDNQAGGTWLGLTRGGRFAAVTNVRQAGQPAGKGASRGELPLSFLQDNRATLDQLTQIHRRKDNYQGFNLLTWDGRNLGYLSNRDPGDRPRELAAGIYGISNALLDTPWPKVTAGKAALGRWLQNGQEESELFKLLADHRLADDGALPDTGVGLEIEKLLSARFIAARSFKGNLYGTRTSTVLLIDQQDHAHFYERNFSPDGQVAHRSEFHFPLHCEAPVP